MPRPPRRRRARLWAWAYLVLFGDGEAEGDDGAAESTTGDGRNDVPDADGYTARNPDRESGRNVDPSSEE